MGALSGFRDALYSEQESGYSSVAFESLLVQVVPQLGYWRKRRSASTILGTVLRNCSLSWLICAFEDEKATFSDPFRGVVFVREKAFITTIFCTESG